MSKTLTTPAPPAGPAKVKPDGPRRPFVACERLGVLLDMLTYKRVSRSLTEERFINRFLRPLPGYTEDEFGNVWIQVGEAPRILWSAHTDSVHHNPGRQTVEVSAHDIATVKRGSGNCLGADDAAGVWLLREMILAGQPGLYIFHREEESGGNGSSYIARHLAHLLREIRFAVAFDRKGYDSVITHQGDRTASDAFARSLAAILNGADQTFRFAPDDSGLFTDTAHYVDLIGECSNVSVGYHMAHGPKESLDLAFVQRLRDVLVAADFSTLEAARKPGEREPKPVSNFAWSGGWVDDWRTGEARPNGAARPESNVAALERFIRDNPGAVADYLDSLGLDVSALEGEIWGAPFH